MNPAELTELVPMLITNDLEDVSAATPIMPSPMHEDFPAWWFRSSPEVLGVAAIYTKTNELRVTLGLAIDIPYSSEVFRDVNRLNNKELVFGRAFLVGNDESGRAAVLMQDIIFGDGISWDTYRPFEMSCETSERSPVKRPVSLPTCWNAMQRARFGTTTRSLCKRTASLTERPATGGPTNCSKCRGSGYLCPDTRHGPHWQ
jgi:hypothetical protein